jgi:hypothetical protein
MRDLLAILLIVVAALHGVHVAKIEVGSIPPLNSARPLSWSSLDQIAAASKLGKGFVLGFDALMIIAGAKLLLRRKVGKNDHSPPPH